MHAVLTNQIADILHFNNKESYSLNESAQTIDLTLIWVGFLGVRFEVGRGGGVKLPSPCLKPVRIMLENSNLARKYTAICSFRKYTF